MPVVIRPDARASTPGDRLTPKLGFGKIFADRMFSAQFTADRGWHEAVVERYHKLELDPAATVLHYSQEIFEGLKAYRRVDGAIGLFRPDLNLERMNLSAERLCMPTIDATLWTEALDALVATLRDWIPRGAGQTLYLRPTMIGTEPFLGVRAAKEFLFFIIASPVDAYFPNGFKPVRLDIPTDYVRAVKRGTGAAKTGGNYAASLIAKKQAVAAGFDEVLWLDAVERRYVEEMGGMNFFAVYGKELITPPLSGSILPGITRRSILELARDWGFKAKEAPIDIDELVRDLKSGRATELFACGTAAVVTPISALRHRGETVNVPTTEFPASTVVYNSLTDIQWGRQAAPAGWIHKVPLDRYGTP